MLYIKTTKTGSSTLRAMSIRFAMLSERRLDVLRSQQPGGIMFGNRLGDASMLGEKQLWSTTKADGTYDIAYDHSTWDRRRLRKYLPGARAVTVSCDPLQRIKSAVAFFHAELTPAQLVKRDGCHDGKQMRVWNSESWQFAVAAAAKPLGLCAPVGKTRATFEKADMAELLEAVDGDGPDSVFFMLTERMDASLVLLRELYCWRWLDVLVPEPPLQGVQQSRENRHRHGAASAQRVVPPIPDADLLALNHLDERLHDAAKLKFGTLVDRYGGEAKLDGDVRLLWRYHLAVGVACLGCCGAGDTAYLANVPLAFRELVCADFAHACDALMCATESTPNTARPPYVHDNSECGCAKRFGVDPGGPGTNQAAAAVEQAMLSLVAGPSCEGRLRNATVCRPHHAGAPTHCGKGELCSRAGEQDGPYVRWD